MDAFKLVKLPVGRYPDKGIEQFQMVWGTLQYALVWGWYPQTFSKLHPRSV